MYNGRLNQLVDYPFQRLDALLGEAAPPPDVSRIDMAIGEPRHPPPPFVRTLLDAAADGWAKYPPTNGTPELRQSAADWLARRYDVPAAMIDPARHIVAVSGSREALFMAALVAVPRRKNGRVPAVLMPNPMYQVYFGGAVVAGAEPVFLPAGSDTGFQPDLGAVAKDTLERTALVYLNSPANPQGSVLSRKRLRDAVTLAREHDFVLAVDECYAEIYAETPPPGVLQACADLGGGCDGVLAFHSLSKRSNVPGLRSGFVAGDAELISLFKRLRFYGGAQVPLPVQSASAALWKDDAHVEDNRTQYRAKFDAAREILGAAGGGKTPGGGFYLWLDVADGEAVAQRLWRRAGVRVMPGAYLSRSTGGGANPGARYIRVALVDDLETTRDALRRLRAVVGS